MNYSFGTSPILSDGLNSYYFRMGMMVTDNMFDKSLDLSKKKELAQKWAFGFAEGLTFYIIPYILREGIENINNKIFVTHGLLPYLKEAMQGASVSKEAINDVHAFSNSFASEMGGLYHSLSSNPQVFQYYVVKVTSLIASGMYLHGKSITNSKQFAFLDPMLKQYMSYTLAFALAEGLVNGLQYKSKTEFTKNMVKLTGKLTGAILIEQLGVLLCSTLPLTGMPVICGIGCAWAMGAASSTIGLNCANYYEDSCGTSYKMSKDSHTEILNYVRTSYETEAKPLNCRYYELKKEDVEALNSNQLSENPLPVNQKYRIKLV